MQPIPDRLRLHSSRSGLVLSFAYVALSVYMILTQGLFGESFIAVILGLPWSLNFLVPLSVDENGPLFSPLLYLRLLGPMAINAALLYWIGASLERRRQSARHSL